jgi:hypothetical protein
MPIRATVAAALALAMFRSPSSRTPSRGVLEEGSVAQSGTAAPVPSQGSCPSTIDFARAQGQVVTFAATPDSVWPAIGDALKAWYKQAYLGDSASRPRSSPSALMMDQDRSAPFQQSSRPPSVGRTCFYEKRVGRRDSRIAFWFAVRDTPRKKRSADIELRWLSQSKGSAERTWRDRVAESDVLADSLVQFIHGRLREKRRSP